MDERQTAKEKRDGLHKQLTRERQIVAKYQEGIRHFRNTIENKMYEIGRLDERMGS